MRFLFVPIALALSACSSASDLEPDAAAPEPVPYAALACDASRASEVAFVFHVSDGYEARPYLPHGTSLLVVDGSCRYHVYAGPAPGGTLRSGVLDASELETINAELLTTPWASLDGMHLRDDGPADAWTITFRRDALEASCYASCSGALATLVPRAHAWVERLWSRGAPLAGAVSVVGEPARRALDEAIEWTGAPLAVRLSMTTPVRIDGSDAALLRSLREEHAASIGPPLFLREGENGLFVAVADELPFALELHADRSPPAWY